jgi:threonine/homoserine/homoserine lactone efflux protein
LTPGPNNIIAMMIGFHYGYRKVLPHLMGVMVGFPVMLLLIGWVLQPIMQRYVWLFEGLKYLSMIYIVYIAWHIATAPTDLSSKRVSVRKPIGFWESVAFQWINPKAWAGALTTVTVYLPPEHFQEGLRIAAILSGATIALAISLWALAGRTLRRWLARPTWVRSFNGTMALMLIVSVGLMVWE